MPIINKKEWEKHVKVNKDDPYSNACIMVARRVMELLDEVNEFDTHQIICQADKETEAGGITGFMAGAVASMVSQCHSRGEEFRKQWNLDTQIQIEGEEANKEGGTLNPALLNLERK